MYAASNGSTLSRKVSQCGSRGPGGSQRTRPICSREDIEARRQIRPVLSLEPYVKVLLGQRQRSGKNNGSTLSRKVSQCGSRGPGGSQRTRPICSATGTKSVVRDADRAGRAVGRVQVSVLGCGKCERDWLEYRKVSQCGSRGPGGSQRTRPICSATGTKISFRTSTHCLLYSREKRVERARGEKSGSSRADP
jgi:hypothetical protein